MCWPRIPSGLKTVADIALARQTGQRSAMRPLVRAHRPIWRAKCSRPSGADIVHVPYKGQAPALTDLLGGQVTMMFGNWPEFRAHVQSGKLIALGMATAKRSVYAPSIPTLTELGYRLESNSWNGLLAPVRHTRCGRPAPECRSQQGAGQHLQ
jgi:hypothetical protein